MSELDRLLSAWGRARRMPDAAAAAMLRAILDAPAEPLPAGWWRDHNAATSRLIADVTRAGAWRRYVAA